MKTLTTIAMLMIGSALLACAAVSATPEIDPASGMSALALLTGAVLVFRGRKK